MKTNFSTNCSTDDVLIRIMGSLGAVSMATCIFALSWLFYLKLHRQFLYRLAAYQVMASLLHALLCVCQFSFVEYDDSEYTKCAAVGYLLTVAVWMKLLFGYCITCHLLCFAVFLKNMKKLELMYFISSILISIAISSVPLITKSYGPSGKWCWIQPKECGTNNAVHETALLVLWFVHLLVYLVLQCIAMLAMMITVYYRAHRKSDDNVFGREQNKKAFRQLLPLAFHPIVFCILIIPALVDTVYGFTSSAPSHGVRVVVATGIPAWSLSSGLTLIIHIGAVKCTKIKRLVLPMVRGRYALTITEEPGDQSYPQDTCELLGSNRDGARSSTYFSIPSDK